MAWPLCPAALCKLYCLKGVQSAVLTVLFCYRRRIAFEGVLISLCCWCRAAIV